MHTLHILPKDLHICKLTAVNVVDVEERAERQRCRKLVMDGRWKERDCFPYMLVPLNLNYRYAPTLHASYHS